MASTVNFCLLPPPTTTTTTEPTTTTTTTTTTTPVTNPEPEPEPKPTITTGDIISDKRTTLVKQILSFEEGADNKDEIILSIDSIIEDLDQAQTQLDLQKGVEETILIFKPLIEANDITKDPFPIEQLERLIDAHAQALMGIQSKDIVVELIGNSLEELAFIKTGPAFNDNVIDLLIEDFSFALSRYIATELIASTIFDDQGRWFSLDDPEILKAATAAKPRLDKLQLASDVFFGQQSIYRIQRVLYFKLNTPKDGLQIEATISKNARGLLIDRSFHGLSFLFNGTAITFPTKELNATQDAKLIMDFTYKEDATDQLNQQISDDDSIQIFSDGKVVDISYYVNDIKISAFKTPVILSFETGAYIFDDQTTPYDLAIFRYYEAEGKWRPVGGTYNLIDRTISVKRMSLSQYTLLKSKKSFSDLEDDDAKDAINKLLNKGVIKSESNFNPSAMLSREEFVSWIASAYGLDNNFGITIPFNDVGKDSDYFDSIAIVYSQGIISGKTATSFKPEAGISKQEIAKIISNTLQSYDNKVYNKTLTQNLLAGQPSVADWSKDYVAMMMGLGIMTGDDLYSLERPVTRAEAALMISTVYQ
ncbi:MULTISPECIES: S-layer homology domain-containing protein [unclassified Fusibacter]|uniref:S-layer homology domain-containing protein n=1 Tax=unclassified Fusibacter TaxID=2624464 RepID=UPI001012CDFB|nr:MULTISPECIES: S-layer homology domain-containing protein [unclassified Fusibacter]MCK8057997.1 S-layer homology domain-containing protein [Fusibacter sp. A2]NPE20579.1 S-layer homology domain-containing protein [Fusibacter sp. A1]RXV62786.1 S-layer homology domain-containing protein [Fusibacter sp. A1]